MRTYPPRINLDKLEEELNSPMPTRVPEIEYTHRETASQVIAQAIIRLSWKEAEVMGAGIQSKVKEGESLTSAIQAWAAEWETFK